MKILVVGPGALGCLLSAFLAETGQDVLLMDHRPDRAEVIAREGLFIEGVSGERRIKVPVSASAGDAAGTDMVLICVKAYHTASAITPLTPYFRQETRVLTLQNGIGNVEALSAAWGKERVWGGITAQGATVLGPGHIRHAGTGDTLIGAAAGSGQEDGLKVAAQIFNQAGLPARVEDEVQPLIWSKLVINVGINPLTAITRLKNGQLLEFPGTREIMAQAVAEAAAVVKAQGIELVYPDAYARVKEVAQATAGNVASMLQDVLAQRRTEIDYINGAVVDLGQKLGLPTPVNETLTRLVRTIQSSYGAGVRDD